MKTSRFAICVAVTLLAGIAETFSVVHIDGTAAERTKIANWLTLSLGTTVGVDAGGNLTIAAGGNAAATRLRNMINDAGTSVTLHIVSNSIAVYLGGWDPSSLPDPKSPTTGTHEIDITDLEGGGNILGSYGFTPDVPLMHEITEVYEGKKNGYFYEVAHALGIAAEVEVMTANGCTWVFRLGDKVVGNTAYGKIKRPDGSFVVIAVDVTDPTHKLKWFTEAVACNFEPSKLIAIADPDPKVHMLSYAYDLNHAFSTPVDTSGSHPTGVAFDSYLRLYVAENHPSGTDELRIFDPQGALASTVTHAQLVNPEGIDVDRETGEFFVAVQGRVLRFSSSGTLMGSYTTGSPSFDPSDVAVWRDGPTQGLSWTDTIYAIFVTDRNTSQVYRFDVAGDMNHGTFVNAFGSGLLSAPEGIQVDDWWTVWVASTGNDRIYRFTPAGTVEPRGGQPYFIEDPTRQFTDMAQIRSDGLYVLDGTTGLGRLLLYDFNGSLVRTYGSGVLQCPKSLAAAFSSNFANLIPIQDPDLGGNPSGIPALTGWGAMILGFVVLTAGAILVWRRSVLA